MKLHQTLCDILLILYLVHRYVLDELADHCPWSSLSDVDLLQVKTVGVWKRQS